MYDAPTIEIVECVIEKGFDASGMSDGTGLPDFDNENTI